MKKYMINDAIHGHIEIAENEMKIIDSPIFQALREKLQLTFVHLVFPSARHSRFEHSIGVFHMCRKYSQHLFPNDLERIQTIKLAGLLHDIAHGAYSHSWDRSVYSEMYHVEKGHDVHRFRIVRELLANEIKSCGVDPEKIIDIWQGRDVIGKAIVNGPIGADRMDFIQRDAFFCGTTHFGTIAADRIILGSSIEMTPDGPRLHYQEKVLSDIIQTILARFSQYHSVYYHKTVSSASLMIESAIKDARDVLNFIERTKDLNHFLQLTDSNIIYEILHSKDIQLENARKIVSDLKGRHLWKIVWNHTEEKKKIASYYPNLDFEKACHEYGKVEFEKQKPEFINNKNIHFDFGKCLTAVDPDIFDKDQIYILKDNNSYSFKDVMKKQKHWNLFCQNQDSIVLFRAYLEH